MSILDSIQRICMSILDSIQRICMSILDSIQRIFIDNSLTSVPKVVLNNVQHACHLREE